MQQAETNLTLARFAVTKMFTAKQVKSQCKRKKKWATYTVATGHVGYCPWSILTVADRSDDTEDKEPQENISSVAQQQDKEQTDHHSYHQTTAKTQTHTHWELTRI